jgi:hypothetical protein
MKEWGAEGEQKLYHYKCEEQKLARGPYLPPANCNIPSKLIDTDRFVDYCQLLNALSSAWQHTLGNVGLFVVLIAMWS